MLKVFHSGPLSQISTCAGMTEGGRVWIPARRQAGLRFARNDGKIFFIKAWIPPSAGMTEKKK